MCVAEEIELEEMVDFALASILARKGVDAGAIGAALNGIAPLGPRCSAIEPGSLIGTGPGSWLAYANRWAPTWESGLRLRLSGLASVSDQSSGYALFRLSGAGTRHLLQCGLSIDLARPNFGTGSAAASVIAHVGVILWQTADRPSYLVACPRSYAVSFRAWLRLGLISGDCACPLS
jgi:heterotetrameric sarcosine oxidase gamma subunit